MEYVLFLAHNAPQLKRVTFGKPTQVYDYVHVAFEAQEGAGIIVKDPRGRLKIRWIWK